jgi:acid phosphatase family membrane protein YuiD
MEDFTKIILMIFFTWFIAEFLKVLVGSIESKKINIKKSLTYGGFPSAHSTLVTSLVVSIFLIEGLSTSLIISSVLFSLVIRDIVVLRRSIDNHSNNISKLSKNKIAPEKISHTALEISSGILIGIIVPLIVYFILKSFNL